LILPLLEGSLFETCQGVAAGALDTESVRWRAGETYCVVLASAGYPDAPRKGDPISGLDTLPDGVYAFHAGTVVRDGELRTNGGRVLTLVGSDRASVYRAAESVQFDGKQFRTDIGLNVAAAVR